VDAGRIRVQDDGQLRRRRLAVLFRAILVLPHYTVLSVWALLAALAVLVSWPLALMLGRVPGRLHRFLAAYLRYQGQVTAWFNLLSGRYPSLRRARGHPFRIEVPERRRQRRLVTLFRLPLAVPALVLSSVLGVILATVAVASWLVAMLLGRTTAGLQELGTFCLRYQLETQAYLSLLTPRYPALAPAVEPQTPQ
jgi:Domain of unknown function (DUF4389)